MWERLHFVFHKPTGHLCKLAMRDWFSSQDAWQDFLVNKLDLTGKFSLLNIGDNLSKIMCVSAASGYWRTISTGSLFELHLIKFRFIPGLEVSDDSCIWNDLLEKGIAGF